MTNAERAASIQRGEAQRRKGAARRQRALALYESGMTYREVGLELGVGVKRAGQLIFRARRVPITNLRAMVCGEPIR